MVHFPRLVVSAPIVAASALAAGVVLPALSGAQPSARGSSDEVRLRVLASSEQARGWLREAQQSAYDQELALYGRQQEAGAQAQKAPDGSSVDRQLVLTSSGRVAGAVTTTVPRSPAGATQARCELLDPAGAVSRSFSVVPYNHFLASESGDRLVAFGNDLGTVWQCGDLLTHVVFYDAQGAVVGRDDGADLSPLRSVLILEAPGLFVMGNPGQIVAWRLADGRRAWTVALPKDGQGVLVRLGSSDRIGAIVGPPETSRFLVIDAAGRTLVTHAYAGRPAPGSQRAVASALGGVVALGDIVDESIRFVILDSSTGEVLRELR